MQKFIGINSIKGCRPGGISTGCKNCCALASTRKLAGRVERPVRISKLVITEDGKSWNGRIEYDDCATRRGLNDCRKTGKTGIMSYMGEVALASEEQLAVMLASIFETKGANVVILTKLPKNLHVKLKRVETILVSGGYPALHKWPRVRISIGTSVETESELYRVKQLKEIPWFAKELWCKPLLEPMPNLNLKGIRICRVNREKGLPNLIRKYDSKWLNEIRAIGHRDNCKVIKER